MSKVYLVLVHDAAARGSQDSYSTVAACATMDSAKDKAKGLCSSLAGSFNQTAPDLWEYDIGADHPVRVREMDLEGSPDMGIAELCETSAKIATEHGWGNDFVTQALLAVGEISEAVEEYREHRGPNDVWYSRTTKSEDGLSKTVTQVVKDTPGAKPEGIAVELADAVIRICDWCGQNKVNLLDAIRIKVAYNRTRPFRHGGKKI